MSKCRVCNKSVYPMDPQINLDGVIFHRQCAKCNDCQCQITISNFTKNVTTDKTILLCKTHYFKRFREGGSYLGGDKFSVKAVRDLQAEEKRMSGRSTPPVEFKTTTEVHTTVHTVTHSVHTEEVRTIPASQFQNLIQSIDSPDAITA